VGVAAPTPGGIVTPAIALQLCLMFGGASLMSIGGGNSVVPEIELQAVDTYHWLTRGQFADLFALAQAAPGPSILIVTLVRYSAVESQAPCWRPRPWCYLPRYWCWCSHGYGSACTGRPGGQRSSTGSHQLPSA